MTQAFNLSQFANKLNSSGQASLTTGVTGTLPIGNGGTGQTTANAALNALLPSQTSNSGKYLQTNGTNTSWVTPAGYTGATESTSGTDITLSNTSNQVQRVAMTAANKKVILPNATTMTTLGGASFVIANDGQFPFDVAETTGFRVVTIYPGESIIISCANNSTASGGWIYGDATPFMGVGLPTDQSLAIFSGGEGANRICITGHSATLIAVAYILESDDDTRMVAGSVASDGLITWGTAVVVFVGSAVGARIQAVSSTTGIVNHVPGTGTGRFFGYSISGTTISLSPELQTGGQTGNLIALDSTRIVEARHDNIRVIQYNGTAAAPTTSASATGITNGVTWTGRAAKLDTDLIITYTQNGSTFANGNIRAITTVGAPTTQPTAGASNLSVTNLAPFASGGTTLANPWADIAYQPFFVFSTTGALFLAYNVVNGRRGIRQTKLTVSGTTVTNAGASFLPLYTVDENLGLTLQNVIQVDSTNAILVFVTWQNDATNGYIGTEPQMVRVQYNSTTGWLEMAGAFMSTNNMLSNEVISSASSSSTTFCAVSNFGGFTGKILNP